MSFATSRSGPIMEAASDVPDTEVADLPNDSISRVAFSPVANMLAVASWNNEVRIYEVSSDRQSRGVAMYTHDGPVLDLCWSKDGSKVFSGGADKVAKCFELSTRVATQVATHAEPVSAVRWIDTPTGGYLATASYDATLKYWNLGNPNPLASVELPERCYTMDAKYPLLVIGTADRHIVTIDLGNPTTILKCLISPLKWQTRTVACLPGGNGWAMGGIEGRLAIQYVEEPKPGDNFSFKCHRKEGAPSKGHTIVSALNNICMHQEYGTFVTCGSDGSISSWDHISRIRLKSFDGLGGPIVSSSYNYNQTIFAYAVAYDWSKGYTGMVADHPNKVFLHACKDDETKRRPSKKY